MAQRREIPTHLDVEDHLFLGLSAGQALLLLLGVVAAYGLFSQWPEAPHSVRLGLAAGCVLVAALLALVRPQGRALLAWLLAAARYAATPRACVWRPYPAPVRVEPPAAEAERWLGRPEVG